MSDTTNRTQTETKQRDWNSMSGVLSIAMDESKKGYNLFGFLSGLAGSILVDPVKKKIEQFKEYIQTVTAQHDDMMEIPTGTKTVLGEDYNILYNKGESNSTVIYRDANGADINCIAPACSYNTEMYTIKSANSWSTIDSKGVSDTFKVTYELALLTKKYADLYSESWDNKDSVYAQFQKECRASSEYAQAYLDFSKNPETKLSYENEDAMKADFDTKYFEAKRSDYTEYYNNYNNSLAEEYTDKLAQYKSFCDDHDIDWSNVLKNVADEMQVEVYEYDKADQKLFGFMSDSGNNKNVANRGYLMLESVMKASNIEVRHPACVQYEYGVGRLSSVTEGQNPFDKLMTKCGYKLLDIKEGLDKSPIAHPIKNVLAPGLAGLDAMFGRGPLVKTDDESVQEPDIEDDASDDKDSESVDYDAS